MSGEKEFLEDAAKYPEKDKQDEFQAALKRLTEQYGIELEPKANTKNRVVQARQWLQVHYKFRYNVVGNVPEYHNGTCDKYVTMVKRDIETIYLRMLMAGIDIPKVKLQAMLESRDVVPDYNEIEDYIYSLPVDDGGKDWIGLWCDQITLVDETKREQFVESFRRWFVNYVAALLVDRVTNQQMFVLVGKQGIFKTTILNNLVPKRLQLEYLYSSGRLYFENKDYMKYLATKMLINWDELGTMSKQDESLLKSVLTDDKVVLRWQYDRNDTQMWRRASFCGSTNNIEFLKDETGNRRYLVFHIADIRISDELLIDRMFAQALRLYKAGFRFFFELGDIGDIEQRNVEFHDTSLEEDLVMRYLRKPVTREDTIASCEMTSTDINVYLAGISNRINVNETTKRRLTGVLRKLGYEMRRPWVGALRKQVRVWVVIKEQHGVSFDTPVSEEPVI
jgi:hypothetical protein